MLGEAAADVAPGGYFTIPALFGLRRIAVHGLPAGWRIAALRHGGATQATTDFQVNAGAAIMDLEILLERR